MGMLVRDWSSAELGVSMERGRGPIRMGSRASKSWHESSSRRSRSPRKERQRPLGLSFLVLDLCLDIVNGIRGGLGHSWLEVLQTAEDFRVTGVDSALPLYQCVFSPF